ncbi:hypothetical protein [Luteibacter sp. PvP120]
MSNSEDDHGLIFSTHHWVVAHRRDARYPGYLIASSLHEASEVFSLPSEALAELGPALARTERLLRKAYAPMRVIFYKLGFSPGFSCHFHIAPITRDLMHEVARHPDYDSDPDGNDAILFLSRVYCERELSTDEHAAQRETVQRLRAIEILMR